MEGHRTNTIYRKLGFDKCDCTVESDFGTGDLSLVL